jgi:hypothetical protein
MVVNTLSKICEENDLVFVDTSALCYSPFQDKFLLDNLAFKKNLLAYWVHALDSEDSTNNLVVTKKIFEELKSRNDYNYRKSIKNKSNSILLNGKTNSSVIFKRIVRDSSRLQSKVGHFFENNPGRIISFENTPEYQKMVLLLDPFVNTINYQVKSKGKSELSEADVDFIANALILSKNCNIGIISNDFAVVYLWKSYVRKNSSFAKSSSFYLLSEIDKFESVKFRK